MSKIDDSTRLLHMRDAAINDIIFTNYRYSFQHYTMKSTFTDNLTNALQNLQNCVEFLAGC